MTQLSAVQKIPKNLMIFFKKIPRELFVMLCLWITSKIPHPRLRCSCFCVSTLQGSYMKHLYIVLFDSYGLFQCKFAMPTKVGKGEEVSAFYLQTTVYSLFLSKAMTSTLIGHIFNSEVQFYLNAETFVLSCLARFKF